MVGNVLSTTYDEARHDKIEASDYKDLGSKLVI